MRKLADAFVLVGCVVIAAASYAVVTAPIPVPVDKPQRDRLDVSLPAACPGIVPGQDIRLVMVVHMHRDGRTSVESCYPPNAREQARRKYSEWLRKH